MCVWLSYGRIYNDFWHPTYVFLHMFAWVLLGYIYQVYIHRESECVCGYHMVEYPQERPTYQQMTPVISFKEYYISAKEPYISAKEPYISAKEPYISAKEPYISAKEDYTSAKESYISAKEPYISAKEPNITTNNPSYFHPSWKPRRRNRGVGNGCHTRHTNRRICARAELHWRICARTHGGGARDGSPRHTPLGKEPCISAKEPYISTKRALYFRKRALHFRKRALDL